MHNYVIGQASHPTTKNHFGPIHNALLHAGRWKRNQHFLCGSVRLYMYTASNGHPTWLSLSFSSPYLHPTVTSHSRSYYQLSLLQYSPMCS